MDFSALKFAKYPGGRGVLPYIGYVGMCGPKGCFSAVLVINRASILADFGHK